jgi:hypothetical protein
MGALVLGLRRFGMSAPFGYLVVDECLSSMFARPFITYSLIHGEWHPSLRSLRSRHVKSQPETNAAVGNPKTNTTNELLKPEMGRMKVLGIGGASGMVDKRSCSFAAIIISAIDRAECTFATASNYTEVRGFDIRT